MRLLGWSPFCRAHGRRVLFGKPISVEQVVNSPLNCFARLCILLLLSIGLRRLVSLAGLRRRWFAARGRRRRSATSAAIKRRRSLHRPEAARAVQRLDLEAGLGIERGRRCVDCGLAASAAATVTSTTISAADTTATIAATSGRWWTYQSAGAVLHLRMGGLSRRALSELLVTATTITPATS